MKELITIYVRDLDGRYKQAVSCDLSTSDNFGQVSKFSEIRFTIHLENIEINDRLLDLIDEIPKPEIKLAILDLESTLVSGSISMIDKSSNIMNMILE